MAIMQIDHGTAQYEQMVRLREEVLRKPLGLSFTREMLDREADDILIGAFEDGRILGCCMLTHQPEPLTIKLRQMAVAGNLQHKGIGHSILRFAELLARDKGYRKMIMNARVSAAGFYEKLGYQIVGDEFIEVTIPHYQMQKELR